MGMICNIFYEEKYDKKFLSDCEFYGIDTYTLVKPGNCIDTTGPGVYMFLQGYSYNLIPYYIGSADNLKRRVKGHKKYKPYTPILFVEVSDKKLAGRVETDWIAMFFDTLENNMKMLRGARPCRT